MHREGAGRVRGADAPLRKAEAAATGGGAGAEMEKVVVDAARSSASGRGWRVELGRHSDGSAFAPQYRTAKLQAEWNWVFQRRNDCELFRIHDEHSQTTPRASEVREKARKDGAPNGLDVGVLSWGTTLL